MTDNNSDSIGAQSVGASSGSRERGQEVVPALSGFDPARIGWLRVIANQLMLDGPFEDWSQVRSHGRAARRRRQGHPQRIRFYHTPSRKIVQMGDTIICHPAMAAEIALATEAHRAETTKIGSVHEGAGPKDNAHE